MSEKNSYLAEVYNQYPFEYERGEGVYLYDTEGREYIDFYGGHAVSILGHSPLAVVDAIQAQAKKLMFYSNLARIPIRARGAEKLVKFANNGFSRAFFCNSGGEANENALKIAIKLTGRSKIVAFKGGFHGRTTLAVGATDNASWHEYLQAWIGPNVHIPANDFAALSVIDVDTAAVILEPIQSIGGVTEFAKDYLQAVRKKCDEVGAKLIFDEVQTGMGRLGLPFVSGSCGVQPDMMTLAKGIAAGFAMGAVLMREEIASGIQKGDIAATFGGGPMAIAAMIACIEEIEKKNLMANAKSIENYIREKFVGTLAKGLRGKGCLLGLELEKPAKQVQLELFKHGIIAGTTSHPEVLHLLPPLTIQKEHVDKLYLALEKVL